MGSISEILIFLVALTLIAIMAIIGVLGEAENSGVSGGYLSR